MAKLGEDMIRRCYLRGADALTRACWSLVMVALLGAASRADAYTTTYYWGADEFGSNRFDQIFYNCSFDEEFPSEFPELCGDETTALLSITFTHDQPIWNNDASGCDPANQPDTRCRTTILDEILGITLSGVADFDPSEILNFYAEDFLGRLPCTQCEGPGPPFIIFEAVDELTGLRIATGPLDDSDYFMQLDFPDGRFVMDSHNYWSRHTVPEPGNLLLLGLGLAALGTVTSRRNHRRRSVA
jgi:PEP-CTERM motif